jgi:predicted RNA-binding Zn-ribbon protein involved in translation (DUF1610 family)
MADFTIEQQCPQCGAPVALEESDRFFSCSHCRVRLYIAGESALRYYLPPAKEAGDDILFVPYWHLRGADFTLRAGDVKCRALDATSRAAGPEQLPLTLGVRAQAMSLRYAVDGVEGRFLQPERAYEETVPQMVRRSRGVEVKKNAEGVVFHSFLASRASLVYAPVTVRGDRIFDGVLNRPQCRRPESVSPELGDEDDTSAWEVKFLAALCPNCGWDLPGERKGVVFLCRHCHRAWRLHGAGLEQVPFEVVAESGEAVYLPFWRMEARVAGLALSSFADLARLANLPLVFRDEWEESGLFFWAPAFQTRPRLFLRLSRQLTSVPPGEEGEGRVPEGEAFPVTLDLPEAFEGVKLTLASLAVSQRKVFPLLPSVKVELLGAKVVYLPFAVQGGDFVQTQMKFGIRRNALRP